MSGDILQGPNVGRFTLDTETDDGSPDNENTYSGIRVEIERLYELLLGTGESGTVTGVSTTVLSNTGASMVVDALTGLTLVITDNLAIAEEYEITANGQTQITISGDLISDGVTTADNYKIFYNLASSFFGHTHDAINSPSVVLADAQVTQAKLKSSTGSVATVSAVYEDLTLPGGEYGFYPQLSNSTTSNAGAILVDSNYATVAPTTNVALKSGGGTAYMHQRYVTSSGDIHWIFYLKDKATGKTISSYEAPDHPCMGNGNRPLLVQHPFPRYDPAKHDIIVINPTIEQITDAIARTIPIVGGGYLTAQTLIENEYEVDGTRPERALLEVFEKEFEIIESKNADWPDIPITVGLPKIWNGKIVNDYRFKVGDLVTPIRVPIEKPDYITPLAIRLKK